jgi:hypothetical protein
LDWRDWLNAAFSIAQWGQERGEARCFLSLFSCLNSGGVMMVSIPDLLSLDEYTQAFIFLLAEIVVVAIGVFFAFRIIMMGLSWLSVFYEKRNGTYDCYQDCTDEDKDAWAAEDKEKQQR